MNIALFVLHIACAIMFGMLAIISTSMICAILSMIVSILLGVCIGMDIARLILDI